jgi:hypothetical protein
VRALKEHSQLLRCVLVDNNDRSAFPLNVAVSETVVEIRDKEFPGEQQPARKLAWDDREAIRI